MLIIRRFSFVVLSFTRHSYKEYKSVQITRGIKGSLICSVTILSVVAIAMPMLKLLTTLQISKASTLRVTRLHFVELQQITLPQIVKLLALVDLLTSVRTKPSCKLRSLLLAKELSTKTVNLASIRLTVTQRRPQLRFSVCHFRRLLSALMSLSNRFCALAATDRLNNASSQHVTTMYAPQARCSMYCCA